jgi:hypothetical protein
MTKKSNLLDLSKKWAIKNKLHGPQAFLRYVMFHFVEKLCETSDDFVFKGGNLLWVYIATPRATIDLDFVTLKSKSDETVKSILQEACDCSVDISFKIVYYKSIMHLEKTGANVVIEYQTDQGAKNRFELDIVFAIETDTFVIFSPINESKTILSASIKNIVADKLSTCQRFAGGNTRMKDYDDLWRLSQSKILVNRKVLVSVAEIRKIPLRLNSEWIGEDLTRMWKSHQRRYKDLPEVLGDVFDQVNRWLESIK